MSTPKAGDELSDAHHALRYVKPSLVDGDKISGAGFMARKGEGAPSVNWLESFQPPVDSQVQKVRELARIKYKPNGRLARVNVGQVKTAVRAEATDATAIRFVHDPLAAEPPHAADPSHALIEGVPEENSPEAEMVQDIIAECVIDVFRPTTG